MLVAALRQRILQLAIQGKLVPQRPEDGTAEELYQQIQQEKKKLIIAGKLKKAKPLPPIKDEEIPFDIPESWKWVKLGALCTICTGKKDANFGSPNGDYLFFTCAKEPLRCNSYSFEGESILLAGNGDISNISFYNGKFEAYQRTYVLQSPTSLYLLYLFYHIKYNWVKYNRGKVFGSAIPYIRLGNLENYLVALPPLAEQKRIVAKVGALVAELDAIEYSQERVAAIQTELNKRILERAIQGKLVPQRPEEGTAEDLYQQIQQEKKKLIAAGKLKKEKPLPPISEDEIPFDIPESWKWVRGRDVVNIISGTSYAKNDERQEGIRIIRGGNVKQGKVNLLDDDVYIDERLSDPEKTLIQGDIVIIGSTGSSKVIGNAGFVEKTDATAQIGAFLRILRAFCPETCGYLNLIFQSSYYKEHIVHEAKGTNINNIRASYINDFLIPLPPLGEQRRIVEKLEQMLPMIEQRGV